MQSLYLCAVHGTEKAYSIDVKPKEQMNRSYKGNSKERVFFLPLSFLLGLASEGIFVSQKTQDNFSQESHILFLNATAR